KRIQLSRVRRARRTGGSGQLQVAKLFRRCDDEELERARDDVALPAIAQVELDRHAMWIRLRCRVMQVGQPAPVGEAHGRSNVRAGEIRRCAQRRRIERGLESARLYVALRVVYAV